MTDSLKVSKLETGWVVAVLKSVDYVVVTMVEKMVVQTDEKLGKVNT